MPVIEVSHLHERYGARVAVDDVSSSVERGEIFGLLGPNGAGKTTTVEAIAGLRVPDGGSVRVLGQDPRRDRQALQSRVGVQLQHDELPERIRVGEACSCTARSMTTRRTGVRCSTYWVWASLGTPASAPCPAARNSACRSRSPSWASRRWPSWTS
jgi:ABC-type multidrug transport system ATPase subunit